VLELVGVIIKYEGKWTGDDRGRDFCILSGDVPDEIGELSVSVYCQFFLGCSYSLSIGIGW
jgi:hypothetical protein